MPSISRRERFLFLIVLLLVAILPEWISILHPSSTGRGHELYPVPLCYRVENLQIFSHMLLVFPGRRSSPWGFCTRPRPTPAHSFYQHLSTLEQREQDRGWGHLSLMLRCSVFRFTILVTRTAYLKDAYSNIIASRGRGEGAFNELFAET